MTPKLTGLLFGFLVLSLIFWVIEFRFPGVRGQKRLRKGFRTDLAWFFFNPLVSKTFTQIVVLAALVPGLLLLGRSIEKEALLAGWGPAGALPTAVQATVLVVAGDFIGYWTHRWLHGRSLWKFHAVHHSSEELDWMSSVRVHPVNEVISRVLRAVPFVLLGFSPAVVAAYVPFLTFHAIMLHANVNWTFGPLRYVVSSPVFHRWHHSAEAEALDKNFAGLFPVWDWMFGTLYMPYGKMPREFGAPGAAVPEGFLAQMAYPLRRR
jgi:sterol desaturase/sphingolipid hydroxylase (fatty acid hydroxylase superfamily)